MNGKNWQKGSQCRSLLPTDPISTSTRIGVVQCFYTAVVDGSKCLFVSIKESHLFNTISNLSVVDIIHRGTPQHLIHLEHVRSLVVYSAYWDTNATHLKIVLHVADTR